MTEKARKRIKAIRLGTMKARKGTRRPKTIKTKEKMSRPKTIQRRTRTRRRETAKRMTRLSHSETGIRRMIRFQTGEFPGTTSKKSRRKRRIFLP